MLMASAGSTSILESDVPSTCLPGLRTPRHAATSAGLYVTIEVAIRV